MTFLFRDSVSLAKMSRFHVPLVHEDRHPTTHSLPPNKHFPPSPTTNKLTNYQEFKKPTFSFKRFNFKFLHMTIRLTAQANRNGSRSRYTKEPSSRTDQ